jgi:DNA processing protein
VVDANTTALVALLQQTRRPWADVREDLTERSAIELLHSEMPPALFGGLFEEAIEEAQRQVEEWEADGIGVSSPFSANYPSQLRSVHDFPPLLFSRGQFRLEDSRAIAVVGTRKPSDGALRFIDELVPQLAQEGHTVVSGLARGVDSAAMRASLRAGNRTVGIIGTGIRRHYPAENRELQDEVASRHLLLSQFWPDAPPTKQSFPMRNHVMSAFSQLTLIVEATEQSGTRIQARAATRHARPLVITRAVFVGTDWAKELVRQRFDVTVVGSASEALRAVQEINERATRTPVWEHASLSLNAG